MSEAYLELKNFFEDSGISSKDFNFNLLEHYSYKFDEFNAIAVIGKGGFGVVKSCIHSKLGKVAVKFIKLERVNNISLLFNEIKTHFQLIEAPYVVEFFGVSLHPNKRLLICLELMDMNLTTMYRDFHKTFGYFPEKLLSCVAFAILSALGYCKTKKIMHRDLKPNNVLVNFKGEIKLADFGVSISLEESIAQSVVGTICYWPPERFEK